MTLQEIAVEIARELAKSVFDSFVLCKVEVKDEKKEDGRIFRIFIYDTEWCTIDIDYKNEEIEVIVRIPVYKRILYEHKNKIAWFVRGVEEAIGIKIVEDNPKDIASRIVSLLS